MNHPTARAHPDPFSAPGRWYRGSLHVHSTASDGALSPDEVVDWYRRRGYDFIALTDHRVLGNCRAVGNDFLVVAGIEVDGFDRQSGLYHLVGLGLERAPRLSWDPYTPMQEAVEVTRAAGGLVMLAHPYWSGQMSKDLLEMEGCFALEVYNGSCEVDDARGYSRVHWDDLLAAGRRWGGTAVDDAHWRDGSKDAGLGWVWVKARSLTQESILDALRQGLFYASTGPEIRGLEVNAQKRQVTVRCTPATWVDFVGNAWLSRRLTAPPGQTLTEVTFSLLRDQAYVRVACHDARGGWAWAPPVFLADLESAGPL